MPDFALTILAWGRDGFAGPSPSREVRNPPRVLTLNAAPALLALSLACSGSTAAGPAAAGSPGRAASAGIEKPGARDANLAGTRCRSGVPCICRNRDGAQAEAPPPDDAHKRFEIRLAGTGGGATLDSPTLGHFAAGPDEACFYIDVLPGTTSDLTFTATEATKEGGIGPVLDIAEYGPKGPWWYDVINVRCEGPNRRCNRDAADAWSAEAKGRKRGRADPCGSSVVSHLTWDTSGGVGNRELGIFKDFTVHFTMEVKRFATQWPPHAKECVAKQP
jgi:hypothetical protein